MSSKKSKKANVKEKASILFKSKSNLNIDVLLGKTGHGKSATGNSILGSERFESSPSTASVTSKSQFEVRRYNDIIIKVVDTPGVADTSNIEDDEEKKKLLMQEMKDAVILNPEGYHAYLLVYKFGTRFTQEEYDSVKNLKEIFGNNIIRDYCIIIMTGGDSYRNKFLEKKFEHWIKEQTDSFKELFKECDYRAVLFNNMTENENEKNTQINELIKLVHSLKTNGKRYTDHHFQEAEIKRLAILDKESAMCTQEDIEEISLILEDAKFICSSDTELSEPIVNRISSIEKRFQKTNAQNSESIIKLTTKIKCSIQSFSKEMINIKEQQQTNKAKFDKEISQLSLGISEYTIINDAYTEHMVEVKQKVEKIDKEIEEIKKASENEYEKKRRELEKKLILKEKSLKDCIAKENAQQDRETKKEVSKQAEYKANELSKEIAKIKEEISIVDFASTSMQQHRDKIQKKMLKKESLFNRYKTERRAIKEKREELEKLITENWAISTVINEGKELKRKKMDLSQNLEMELRNYYQEYNVLKDANTEKLSKKYACTIL